MKPLEFNVAALSRLGAPCGLVFPGQRCASCGADVDPQGFHYLHCKGSSGHLIGRHDDVNKVCGCATKRAFGGVIAWEVPGVFGIPDSNGTVKGNQKRADFTHTHSDLPSLATYDTSITSPVCDSHVAAAQERGGAVEHRAEHKIKKHGPGAAHNGVTFTPLCFGAFGTYGKHAKDWLKSLAKRLGDADDEDDYSPDQRSFVDRTRKSVSVALQKGNARCIIYRARIDRFASGRALPPVALDWNVGAY